MTTKITPVIAGCKNIAESMIGNTILDCVIDDLVGTTDFVVEVGSKPVMPSPFVNPEKVVFGGSIKSAISDLPCTWIQVERLDRYGTYYRFIALFGDRHWVTCDRSGHHTLRIFSKSFN